MTRDEKDRDRVKFLLALQKDQGTRNPLLLTEWEQNFLRSFDLAGVKSVWMTQGRAAAADRMWAKYGELVGHPLLQDAPKIERGARDVCHWFVKGERGQERCGKPATKIRPSTGFEWCSEHYAEYQKGLKKKVAQ